jgi:hypothetical protein
MFSEPQKSFDLSQFQGILTRPPFPVLRARAKIRLNVVVDPAASSFPLKPGRHANLLLYPERLHACAFQTVPRVAPDHSTIDGSRDSDGLPGSGVSSDYSR